MSKLSVHSAPRGNWGRPHVSRRSQRAVSAARRSDGMALDEMTNPSDAAERAARRTTRKGTASLMAKLWYSPVPLSSENTALWQGGGADSQRREGGEAEEQRFSKHSVPPHLRLLRVLRRRRWCGAVFNAETQRRGERRASLSLELIWIDEIARAGNAMKLSDWRRRARGKSWRATRAATIRFLQTGDDSHHRCRSLRPKQRLPAPCGAACQASGRAKSLWGWRTCRPNAKTWRGEDENVPCHRFWHFPPFHEARTPARWRQAPLSWQ